MGRWTSAGSHWTYSPYLSGSEDPNLPPSGQPVVRGPVYTTPEGKEYNTWLVPFTSPDGSVTEQTIVDWASLRG